MTEEEERKLEAFRWFVKFMLSDDFGLLRSPFEIYREAFKDNPANQTDNTNGGLDD